MSVKLYCIPTMDEYSGATTSVFVNPDHVASIIPYIAEIGQEFPGTKKVKGTQVLVTQEAYFVALSPSEVADKLGIELLGQEQEASA